MCMVWNKTNILVFFFIWLFVCKTKNEAMPSGNFKTDSSGPRLHLHGYWKLEIVNWKLTEIKPAKKKIIEASPDLDISLKLLKWNSRQIATKAVFAIEYESNLCVKA